MTETFRAVEPLSFAEVEYDGRLHIYAELGLTVTEARLLRDWLNCAIPCEHIFTHQRFNVQVCDDCGATLPDDDAVYCKKCGDRTDTYPIGSYHKCGAALP